MTDISNTFIIWINILATFRVMTDLVKTKAKSTKTIAIAETIDCTLGVIQNLLQNTFVSLFSKVVRQVIAIFELKGKITKRIVKLGQVVVILGGIFIIIYLKDVRQIICIICAVLSMGQFLFRNSLLKLKIEQILMFISFTINDIIFKNYVGTLVDIINIIWICIILIKNKEKRLSKYKVDNQEKK